MNLSTSRHQDPGRQMLAAHNHNNAEYRETKTQDDRKKIEVRWVNYHIHEPAAASLFS
jgi:hypothetical protein